MNDTITFELKMKKKQIQNSEPTTNTLYEKIGKKYVPVSECFTTDYWCQGSYLVQVRQWRDEKVAELEKANTELNRKLQIATTKYKFRDQKIEELEKANSELNRKLQIASWLTSDLKIHGAQDILSLVLQAERPI